MNEHLPRDLPPHDPELVLAVEKMFAASDFIVHLLMNQEIESHGTLPTED